MILQGELLISNRGDWERYQGDGDHWHVSLGWVLAVGRPSHPSAYAPSSLPFTSTDHKTKYNCLKTYRDRDRDSDGVCVWGCGSVCVCVSHAILLFPNFCDSLLPSGSSTLFSLAFKSLCYLALSAHCPLRLTLCPTQDTVNLHIWADSCLHILAHILLGLKGFGPNPSVPLDLKPCLLLLPFSQHRFPHLASASLSSLGPSYLSHSLVICGVMCMWVSCLPKKTGRILRAKTSF